jgi:hypothetical protein
MKTKIRETPKFLKILQKSKRKWKRTDHVRCLACYTINNGNFVKVGDGPRSMNIVNSKDIAFMNE